LSLRTCLPAVALCAALLTPAHAQGPTPMVGSLTPYETRPGENLFQIAYDHRLSVDLLAFANGFPVTTTRVAPGTRLILPTWRILPVDPPANGIVVNLPERGLYLFRGGKYSGFYPISIGDEVKDKGRFSTGGGNYTIIEKVKNPVWTPPDWAKDRRPVGAGPKNPLGDRWIGLSMPRTGIHGTNEPLNIGNSVTHGCMRTYPKLIKELFDLVEVGWPVRIEYETAKVGRDANGNVYVASFPDVYGRKNPVKRMHQLLAEDHLEGQIGRSNFDSVIDIHLGFPVALKATDPVFEEVSHRFNW
jgi:lipoprotein-anchoring transpeptidase ErfK/SrfK